MPPEALHQRAWHRVEQPHEPRVVEPALQSAVQPGLHGKPLGHDSHARKILQQIAELANRIHLQDGRVHVLQVDLGHTRQRVQPGDAVVDLEHRDASGSEHTAAFANERAIVGRVLDDPVRVDQVEGAAHKRQGFAVGHEKRRSTSFEREVLSGKTDRRGGKIDAGGSGAVARKAEQIGSRSASHFEHATSPELMERNQARQMVQLLEVILLEIGKESWRAGGMARDVQIVYVGVPVGANGALRCRGVRRFGHRSPTIRYSCLIRDLSQLGQREFDLLVVGGGIYGLTVAYDAAQRGLSVALVERSDFGSATSFNHLKTIHGGLRYLQTADVTRMRESIRERRAFARIAPRFVSPLAFVMPTGASLTRNPLAMKTALALDALVGRDRHEGVDATHHLPPGRVIQEQECRHLFEGALRTVASGAMWFDYETVQGDRLTLSFATAAAHHGAVLANYTEAVTVSRKTAQGRRSVQARDVLTGQPFEIRTRATVNAAGPWVSTFLQHAGLASTWPLMKAMNLVTSRPARKMALVAPTRAGRALVLLPWQGRTLVGTSESADERTADDQRVTRTEVTAFLAEVNETFPALDLSMDEITLVHRGVVPAENNGGTLALLGHSRIVDHAPDGMRDLISVIGVKYTTARAVAEQTVDLILTKLGRPAVACRTSEVTLPGAALSDSDPPDPLIHAVRHEMAHTLTDVIVRRTGVGAAGYPGEAVATEYAARMQQELGWTDERRHDELAALRKFYEVLEF
jgi:glycerol-3-phosphate dehydrogenase